MLFNSYAFIFWFLPVAYLGGLIVTKAFGQRRTLAWLTACSFFFYGWWNPSYLALLLALIFLNFFAAGWILRLAGNPSAKRWLFVAALAMNLGVLCYFKYANFLVSTVNQVAGTGLHLHQILLPLGISFFTFQKIAYLVDAYQGKLAREDQDPLKYSFFVSFFPQLIAGPIVHYREIDRELKNSRALEFRLDDFTVGLAIFVGGLFKKLIIADGVAAYSSPIFDAVSFMGHVPNLLEAWFGALAYSLQIYFDFSGYSEMAVGLGLLFGIRLPMNFYSPYKAQNIIEFWRRWHITLSRFLRDYLYIPLGGNRRGEARRYANLLTTMLLGGLWHGAGINFILWGFLHGAFLTLNHWWQSFCGWRNWRLPPFWRAPVGVFSTLLTYGCVTIAWVFFRAPTFAAALTMVKSMIGLNGISLPTALTGRLNFLLGNEHIRYDGITTYGLAELLPWLVVPHLIVWFSPNVLQIMGYQSGARNEEVTAPWAPLRWRPNVWWALGFTFLSAYCLLSLSNTSEFLYFQF